MKTKHEQLEMYSLRLDVDYTYECVKYALGTGDSPNEHYVDVKSIELNGEDISQLLSDDVLNEIDNKILRLEVLGDDCDE
jgi:hypothetical protein